MDFRALKLRRVDLAGPDETAWELMPASALSGSARAMVAQAARRGAAAVWSAAPAALWREHARRTGRLPSLADARVVLSMVRGEAAAVALERARCDLVEGELTGEPDAEPQRRALVLGPAADWLAAERQARAALAADDLDAAIAAAAALDAWLDGAGAVQPATLRFEAAANRVELMLGFGARLGDRPLLERAAAEAETMTDALDPERRPVSAGRAGLLRGQALAALGEAIGEPQRLAEACAALQAAADALDPEHSPLDRLRIDHALGLGVAAFGEAVGEPGPALQGLRMLERVLAAAPDLPLRAALAHDHAALLARTAGRAGDLGGLDRAEGLFRAELRRGDPRRRPVAWALTQGALAAVYEAQAGLRGDRVKRTAAAVALTAALDVFAERGLKTQADAALAALERLRARV